MSLDAKRLVALKSTLRKGQDIWLEMYLRVFKNVRCLSIMLSVEACILVVPGAACRV